MTIFSTKKENVSKGNKKAGTTTQKKQGWQISKAKLQIPFKQ